MHFKQEIWVRGDPGVNLVDDGLESETACGLLDKQRRHDCDRARRRVALVVRKDMGAEPAACRLYVQPHIPIGEIEARGIVGSPCGDSAHRVSAVPDDIELAEEPVY